MTTLQRVLQLLEACSDAYYISLFEKSYLPESMLSENKRARLERCCVQYESKIHVLYEVLYKHQKMKETAENAGRWTAQKRFYEKYPQYTPQWWSMETLIKWKEKHGEAC